jgi:transposase
MLSLSSHQRYFVYNGIADMRNGFDGLSGLVRNKLDKDPVSSDVFVFFNRNRTQVKLLCWDQDGFAVYHKRLERGVYELISGNNDSAISLNSQTLSLILQGIILSSVKKKKRHTIAA